jgi:hypothetical protein
MKMPLTKTSKTLIVSMLVIITVILFWCRFGYAEEDIWACYGSQRYEAMSSGWPACNERTFCDKLKVYLKNHTEAEARAEAVAKHLPQWVVRKAEKCMP